MKTLDDIILEDEQLELLNMLVEASRNTPREKRQKFFVSQTKDGDVLMHPSLKENKIIYVGDVEILAKNELLSLTTSDRNFYQFDVTPIGFKFYELQKNKVLDAGFRVEHTVRKYLDTTSFESKYPIAHKKWMEAENLLWSSDSDSQFTLIGHLCREAIQEFIQHLVENFNIENVDPDKSKTVSRFRTIMSSNKTDGGKTVKTFMDSILTYFGTLNDLIQRQEHGGQKESTPLNWEDSRRVVFESLIVMYEIDKSI